MGHDTDFQYETLQDSGNIGIAVVHIKSEFYYTEYEVKVQVRFFSLFYQNILYLHNSFSVSIAL